MKKQKNIIKIDLTYFIPKGYINYVESRVLATRVGF